MSVPNRTISANTIIILLFSALSLTTAFKASHIATVFINNNTRVFDGVTYEYRRQELFDRFNNDFSLANRYSRAYFEWDGNFGSGAYHAILCLLSPRWLSSGLDIPLRAAFALFTLLVALDLFLRPYLSRVRIGLLSVAFSQIPSLCDPRNGIGTYIPDSIAAMLLMAAIIFLMVFARDGKSYTLVVFSALLITGAIFIRLNFVIHSGLVVLVLMWPLAKAWKQLPTKRRFIMLSLCSMLAVVVIYYFLQQLDRFVGYYNEIIYDQVGHATAISVSIDTFLQSVGWWGVALLGIILLLVLSSSRVNVLQIPKYHVFLLTLPFIMLYGIPILVKRAPYIPHVLNSSFLTLPLLMIALGLVIRSLSTRFQLSCDKLSLVCVRTAAVLMASGIIAVSSLNYAHAIEDVSKTLSQYTAARSFISIVEHEAQAISPDTLRFIALFDDLLHFPINTALRKDYDLPTADFVPFSTKPSLMTCETTASCTSLFKNEFKRTRLVAVNDPLGPVNANLREYPLAHSVVNAIYRELIKANSGFTPIDTITSEVHGHVVIFQSLKRAHRHDE
jgi:hypothetical protein